MPETYRVAMADVGFARYPDSLETQALGSCLGIVLYDPNVKIAGMCHAMLPDIKEAISDSHSRPTKFVNSSILFMIDVLSGKGASPSALLAKIAGGSNMFPEIFSRPEMTVGHRNVESAKTVLRESNIKIVGEDTGGSRGRTIIFDTNTMGLTVRTISGSTKVI